jgi:phosphohistidine phosphatase SixA
MRIGTILLCLLLCCGHAAAAEDASALWAELRQQGRVALVRHAATSGGVGDPPGFRLDDCASQRNLTERGRADARALGEHFRRHAVDVGKVLSSQWCRCRETAELMALGPIETAPTFNNAFILRDRVDALTVGARAVIAAWSGPRALVVVTHGANIRPLTGTDPGEGGLMVVVPDRALAAGFRVLGRIGPGQ